MVAELENKLSAINRIRDGHNKSSENKLPLLNQKSSSSPLIIYEGG